MDVKEKLTQQEKATFENTRVEIMVLEHLLAEKKQQIALYLKTVLEKLGYNPQLYGLEYNANQDKWEIKLRPDALAMPGQMPNRQERRHPIGG